MENDSLMVTKIKEWIQLDTEITSINNSMKDMKKMKKKLSDDLVGLMKADDIEVVKLNDGSIELKKNKVKKALNKKDIITVLNSHIEDNSKVTELVNTIFEQRDYRIKEFIKRNH